METKQDILNHIFNNIDIDLIIKKNQIINVDEMRQLLFMILSKKDFDWLKLRYDKRCFERVIYTIVRNQKNDHNSEFHKIVDLSYDSIIEKDIPIEPNTYFINGYEYDKEDCLNELEKLLKDKDFWIRLYKEYIYKDLSLKSISRREKINFRFLKRRFVEVEKYLRFELLKKINNKNVK